MAKNKILITGGFGYIGTRLAEDLHALGHEVRLMVHRRNPDLEKWSRKFEVFEADVTKRETLSRACEGTEAVIHLASLNEIDSGQDPALALQVNSLGTRNMLEVASSASVKRFIYFSTFHVYGISSGEIDETSPTRPRHDYATTHLFGEQYCWQFRKENVFEPTVIRLTNGYGAPAAVSVNRWSLVVNDLCRMAVEKEKLILKSAGTQKRDFFWLGDLTQAMELILGTESKTVGGEVFNLGGGLSLSIREIAEKVQHEYEAFSGKNLSIEAPAAEGAPEESSLTVRLDKIRALGFEPHDELSREMQQIFGLISGGLAV